MRAAAPFRSATEQSEALSAEMSPAGHQKTAPAKPMLFFMPWDESPMQLLFILVEIFVIMIIS